MKECEHIYAILRLEGVSVDIDDLIEQSSISHWQYRQWCYRNELPLPPNTPGLYWAITDDSEELPHLSIKQIANKYRADPNWIYACRDNPPKKKQVALTAEVKEQIIQAIKENKHTRVDIAHMHNVTYAQVNYLAQQCRASSYTKLTKEQKALLREKKSKGATVASLAKEFNIGRATVFRICQGDNK